MFSKTHIVLQTLIPIASLLPNCKPWSHFQPISQLPTLIPIANLDPNYQPWSHLPTLIPLDLILYFDVISLQILILRHIINSAYRLSTQWEHPHKKTVALIHCQVSLIILGFYSLFLPWLGLAHRTKALVFLISRVWGLSSRFMLSFM
jgi:hypothetical protein